MLEDVNADMKSDKFHKLESGRGDRKKMVSLFNLAHLEYINDDRESWR